MTAGIFSRFALSLHREGWLAGGLSVKIIVLLGQNQFTFAGLAQRVDFARMLDQHFALAAEQLVTADLPALRLVAGGNHGRARLFHRGYGGCRFHSRDVPVLAWLLNAEIANQAAGMRTSAIE